MESAKLLILLASLTSQAFTSDVGNNVINKAAGSFFGGFFPPAIDNNPFEAFIKAATDGVKNVADGTTTVVGQVESGLKESNQFGDTFNQIVEATDTGITEPLKQIFETFNTPNDFVDQIMKAKDEFVVTVQGTVSEVATFLENLLEQALEAVKSVLGMQNNLLPDMTSDLTKLIPNGLPNFETFSCAQKFLPQLLEAAKPTGTHLSNCAIFHGAEMQKNFDLVKMAFSFMMNMESSNVLSNLDQCHRNASESERGDLAPCVENAKTDFANAANQINKTAEYIKDSSPIQLENNVVNIQNCYNGVFSLFKDIGDQLKNDFMACLKTQ